MLVQLKDQHQEVSMTPMDNSLINLTKKQSNYISNLL